MFAGENRYVQHIWVFFAKETATAILPQHMWVLVAVLDPTQQTVVDDTSDECLRHVCTCEPTVAVDVAQPRAEHIEVLHSAGVIREGTILSERAVHLPNHFNY